MNQVKPPGMKGMQLLEHMTAQRMMRYGAKPHLIKKHTINPALGCSPQTKHQAALVEVDYEHRAKGAMLADIREGVPKHKAAQVRLDGLAYIKTRSGIVNDPERMGRMEAQLKLQKSMGMIAHRQKEAKEQKKADKRRELNDVLPTAIKLFLKGETKKKNFTIACIKAILQCVFNVEPKKS